MPPEAMLGFDTADDAAVWRIAPNIAGILTIDFLTPIVDEPYDFGRIAAANALSDVFAMGGVPNVALNVVAMDSTLPEYVPRDMLRGGLEKVIEAGAVIMGGHSIDDEEPKYGLCVFGTVAPDALVRNGGAKPGDTLYLTKPLGTGIASAGRKVGILDDAAFSPVVESMAELNRAAGEAMVAAGVHAATDVTGFGFAGHLRSFSVEDFAQPFLHVPDNQMGEDATAVLCDPQTSGGMLCAIPSEAAATFEEEFAARCGRTPAKIGRVIEGESGHIHVVE